jgi:D-alanyl-D-alanine carboxypeptidase
LGGVKTLSGYMTTPSGEPLAFSILTNNLNAPAKLVTDAMDRIVVQILNSSSASGKKKK